MNSSLDSVPKDCETMFGKEPFTQSNLHVKDSFTEKDFSFWNSLPGEWKRVKIGDLFSIQQGKAISTKHRQGKNSKPFLRTANVYWGRLDLSKLDQMDFTNEEEERYTLLPGDLLVCEGGDIGRTALWQGEIQKCYHQNHLHRLRVNNENVVPEFYLYWLWAGFQLLGIYGSEGNKTTIPNLSQSRLKNFDVALPPLAEQRAIARVLTTVRQAIEATERVIEATRQLKKAMVKHLITDIVNEWTIKNLFDVVDVKSGGTPNTKIPDYWNGKVDWVSAEDVSMALGPYIKKTKRKITSLGLLNSAAKVLPEHTIVLIARGATMGRVKMLSREMSINQTCYGLVVRPGFDPIFIFYLLENMMEEFQRLAYGAIFTTVTIPTLREIKVSAPNFEKQQEISKNIMAVDRKILGEIKYKRSLEIFFQCLLKNLMTGKMRVNEPDVTFN